MSDVVYLKKKKMYEMLKSLVNTDLDIMKNASYYFYHGSEWIECCSDDGVHYTKYKFYHAGNVFSLDISAWNEEKGDYKEKDRITYQMNDGQLVKNYQRTEAVKETEEIRSWLDRRNMRR